MEKKVGGETMKFDLDPTVPKVVIIAILLFVETVCLATYAILMTGRLPTDVECLTILFGAVLPLLTYLLTFLGFGEKET